MVNIQGERVINEEFMQTTPFFGNIVARQKNRCTFMIFDEDTKKYYQEIGLDFRPGVMLPFNLTTIDNFDNELKQALDKGSKELFLAGSSEELAAKTGIDSEELKKTIAEYNQACETGRDIIFNKNPRYLRPVKRSPFYAAKLVLGGFGTLGGIKINYRTEVLNKDFEVIPGLYAAGVDANSITGDTYIFILPGSTFGFAVNSGRIAGEEAARYIKSK
jgi:fumarate reductase flavoprotein subunit